MSAGKEIRNKIKSIGNTQKITSAMEMVAASKMRKTQEQMNASRPYATEVIRLASHLAKATRDDSEQHSYLVEREVKTIGIIVVSSDRGLCGGLNNNLFKVISDSVAAWIKADIKIKFASIGSKANSFFARYGGDIVATETDLGDVPSSSRLIGLTQVMLELYDKGEIDELHIFSNDFVNTMTQRPTGLKVLPLVAEELKKRIAHPTDQELESKEDSSLRWDYTYDSAPDALIDIVLDRYISSTVYQAVVENLACEMAARMIAMKAASDNAGDLIDELQLVYNKARQASITQEITEIVSGAAAIN